MLTFVRSAAIYYCETVNRNVETHFVTREAIRTREPSGLHLKTRKNGWEKELSCKLCYVITIN